MKNLFRDLLLSTIIAMWPLSIMAQEHEESHEEEFQHHRVSLVIGHTHIPKGSPSVEDSRTLIVPSWGLDYEYWFNHKVAVGMHNDFEIFTYVVESEDNPELERERPLILSTVFLYRITGGLVAYLGPGVELERHENFFVYRVGLEYEFEMNNGWDISPGLHYDNKNGVYDSWSIGLGVGKRF